MTPMRYKSGYKYILDSQYLVHLHFLSFGRQLRYAGPYLGIDRDELKIAKGYAWDGPSGPTFDTKTFMRASLVHDALYQLIRMEVLPVALREDADAILHRICREDGMSRFRAWYCWKAVRRFGGSSALAGNVRRVEEAP